MHIVYVTIKVGVAKRPWTSWPRPLPLCPYEAFSKVGDYMVPCEVKSTVCNTYTYIPSFCQSIARYNEDVGFRNCAVANTEAEDQPRGPK